MQAAGAAGYAVAVTNNIPLAPVPAPAPTDGAATPTSPAGFAAMIPEADGYDRTLDAEYNTLAETIKSYVIFGIALSTLVWVQTQFGFFYVLVLFIILFVLAAHLKAYVLLLKSDRARGGRNRTLLANIALVVDLALGFVTVLLVQIILARVTPFLSDGNFHWESLVLPFALFALLFGEWYARRARTTPELDRIDPS